MSGKPNKYPLENVVYINLESRKDRKEHIEKELDELGWKYERFNAIPNKKGIIGCGFSHLKVILNAKEKNLDYVVVLEDDAQFLDKSFINQQVEQIFRSGLTYDVLLLSGNMRPPLIKNTECPELGNHIYQTRKCWFGTAYVVKKHYYDVFIANVKEGLHYRMTKPETPENVNRYAWDAWWMRMQEKDKWLIVLPRTVVQRADYSNIENRYVDYRHLMSDVRETE